MKRIIQSIALSFLIISLSGCFGSFNLTKNVYEMNDNATENGFVKSALMVGLLIIPVYEIAAIADILVLNTIEFWTGENPVAMDEGERRRQVFSHNGKTYVVDAEKDQFTIRPADDQLAVHTLWFDRQALQWKYSSPDSDELVLLQFTGPSASSFTLPLTGSNRVWYLD